MTRIHLAGFGTLAALGVALVMLNACSSISPVRYEPEPPITFEGKLAVNTDLTAAAPLLEDPALDGPETMAIDPLQPTTLYTGLENGQLARIDMTAPARITEMIDVGGRVLGVAFGPDNQLYMANHGLGLQRLTRDGRVELLVDEAEGAPILFADDLDVAQDGWVYVSDASAKFNSTTLQNGPPYSPLDAFEARPHGRLIAHHPDTGETRVLARDMYFANGVAVSHDQQSVLVVETTRYRVSRVYVKGSKAGQREVFMDRLPGFADGIWRDPNGGYWLTFQTGRSGLLDNTLHPRPFLKRIVAALPRAAYVSDPSYGLLLKVDEAGNVMQSYHDPSAEVAGLASAVRHGNTLLMGTLVKNVIWQLPLE